MNGILLVDKEQNWTSNDVVVKLKGILHQRRVGHAGTLDPMATGLLVVFAGRATKAVSFAEQEEKRYRTALHLGVVTDTQDIWGTVREEKPADVSSAELERVLEHFTGEQMQLPPMYSAIHVNGKRLYDIARRGGEVEREARRICVRELKLLGQEGGDWILDIRCSRGTYVRTLCHDIGAALGCGGCMSALRRTETGPFSVDHALTVSEIWMLSEEGKLGKFFLPTDSLFTGSPACRASSEEERRIRCGTSYETALPDGEYRVYSEAGEFLMLGRSEQGSMRTVKNFFEV